MAYNKKYATLGESVIDYVNDREDAIESGFEDVAQSYIKRTIDGENLDTITQDGFYTASSTPVNIQSFGSYYGYLEVLTDAEGIRTVQTFTSYNNEVRFVRTRSGSAGWFAWKKIY